MLLITSRGTGRWVIPKGNPIRGLHPHQAAAREAFEEAGITGMTAAAPLGTYRYRKLLGDGRARRALVSVYPLAVEAHSDEWPERGQRDTCWFSLASAAAAVEEPELKAIIVALRDSGLLPVPDRMTRLRRWLRDLLPAPGRDVSASLGGGNSR